MSTLVLHLKKIWFDSIAQGLKPEEYRLATPYWTKRIEGKNFETVTLLCGYPKRGDTENTLVLPWQGYERITITHPEFGPEPVDVFAIKLNENRGMQS